MKHFLPQEAPWLFDSNLQALLEACSQGGEEARVVGGAVRNTLLGESVSDIDIATTTFPQETAKRAKKLGFQVVLTGVNFGTVTVIARGQSYEVTTLRADMETDGRYAKVCFRRDWKVDAERRDFTINALYADRNGRIYDDVGGLKDIEKRILRFIGNAEDRIREDYLRILRFFRLFAWIGVGYPDPEALKASARLKEGLHGLSAERVWSELKKLFCAPDPVRSLMWMHQSRVLTVVLPEMEKWGIDSINALVDTEKTLSWKIDPMLRLQSIVLPDVVRMKAMSRRLRFSNAEKNRLVQWAMASPIQGDMPDQKLKEHIYREGRQPVLDRLQLTFAGMRARIADDGNALFAVDHYTRLDFITRNWKIPVFPVNGQDLLALGFNQGPEIGSIMAELKNLWIAFGFQQDKAALLSFVRKKASCDR
ncbi:MAG: poly(A) polymerase [Candidatus Tokpelaia sp. JSC189]|nr:MAG: poly(A) polymerase [Candidatus Tokpelaia sp. JSC189]